MPKLLPVLLPLLLTPMAGRADTCEAVQAQIDAKLKASGVSNYTLLTLDLDDPAAGRIVGNCGFGKKKIVYTLRGGSVGNATGTMSAPFGRRESVARQIDDKVLTECKEGFTGADCSKRRLMLDSTAPARPSSAP